MRFILIRLVEKVAVLLLPLMVWAKRKKGNPREGIGYFMYIYKRLELAMKHYHKDEDMFHAYLKRIMMKIKLRKCDRVSRNFFHFYFLFYKGSAIVQQWNYSDLYKTRP